MQSTAVHSFIVKKSILVLFSKGLSKKDKDKMIIILSKDLQEKALKIGDPRIKPFSHGAKKGWIEVDCSNINSLEEIFFWIRHGYNYARTL